MSVKCFCPYCQKTVIPEREHDGLADEDVITCPKCHNELNESDIDCDDGIDEVTEEEEIAFVTLLEENEEDI